VNKLILNSYAKLNLYLEVLKKRKDNYHNIKTVFERIDLCDKIVLKARLDKKIKIESRAKDIPKDNSNLAYRSAQLLQDSLKVERGVDIEIIKRIHVGSGLGGGSSNAAVVLMGLNKLWRLGLSRNRLVSLAQKIGSDVPFFIYNIPFAQGEARGDRIRILKSLKKLRLWHILVVPRIKVSTPVIYNNWDKMSVSKKAKWTLRHGLKKNLSEVEELTRPKYDVKILHLALRKRDFNLISGVLFNSLQQITARLYPELIRIKRKLEQLGLKSILMSGSGPATFGIFYSRKEAVFLCRQLKQENKSWQVFVTRTI
jgi:4-diphosphocytidyl-2-C-methyl-D-erythritol kinase